MLAIMYTPHKIRIYLISITILLLISVLSTATAIPTSIRPTDLRRLPADGLPLNQDKIPPVCAQNPSSPDLWISRTNLWGVIKHFCTNDGPFQSPVRNQRGNIFETACISTADDPNKCLTPWVDMWFYPAPVGVAASYDMGDCGCWDLMGWMVSDCSWAYGGGGVSVTGTATASKVACGLFGYNIRPVI